MAQKTIDYSRITTRTFEQGCDYTSDWMAMVDEGFNMWRSTHNAWDKSYQKYSETNMVNSFDRLITKLQDTHPHLVGAMHLANLIAMVGSAGFKAWVDTGSGRYVQEVLTLLDDIPGPDALAAHGIIETILPYIDLDVDSIGEWVSSIERRTINHCVDELVFIEGQQPFYETHCSDLELDVEVCLIWDRLPELTEQFNALRDLIPEIGAWFMVTYTNEWE